uniref:Dickkopf5 protein n=1 Tax=Terebratalia transversa TaxID=34513 RepID=A0AAU7EB79_TERTR
MVSSQVLVSAIVFWIIQWRSILCSAYIWNFALSSTLNNKVDYDNFHPRNIRAFKDRISQHNAIDKQEICKTDKSCGKGKFCDRHYGFCDRKRQSGQYCRRDGQCEHGLQCMFGKCTKSLKHGTIGARCRHDKDCGASMCCARQHGERICKAKLKIHAKCYVPQGGLEYSLNEMCPCDRGLTCKPTLKQKDDSPSWRFWSTFDHMRCSPG